MASQLPQEIVNAIIDNISSQAVDKPSLLACTLVSRSFSSPARRHLFSTISIRWKQKRSVEAQVSQLLLMLNSRSDMRFLIKSLLVEDKGYIRPTSGSSTVRAMDDTSDLFNLFRALTGAEVSLKALYINCCSTSANCHTSWHNIGAQTRSALINIFPQLTFLRIVDVRDVPFAVLKDMPLMETLELCQVRLEAEDEECLMKDSGRVGTTDSLSSIVSLRVDGGLGEFLDHSVAAGIAFPRIKSFRTLVSDSEDIHAVWKLIQKANGMDHLEIKLYTDCSFMSQSPVDLGQLSHLRSLRLRLSPIRISEHEALPHALNLLYPRTRPTSISALKVSLSSPYILSSAEDFLPEQISRSWAVLQPEKLLEVHPNLKSIKVEVDLSQSAVKWTHAPNVQPPSKAQVLLSLEKRIHESIFGSQNSNDSTLLEASSNIITFNLKAPSCLHE